MKKALLALVAASGLVGAPCWAGEWSPFLGGGITVGGDRLVQTSYVNGETDNLHTGGLFDLRAGLDFRMVNSDISLQGVIAYHSDRSDANNGSVDFTRMPIEFLVQWHINPRWAVGGGLRKALETKYNGIDAGTQFAPDQKYKSSMGWILEGEFAITPSVGLKARYIKEDYTGQIDGKKFDGSHFGLLGVYYFR